MLRIISFTGIICMMGIAWIFSNDKRNIPYRVILWGCIAQLVLGFIMVKSSIGFALFNGIAELFIGLLQFANDGARFLFGYNEMFLKTIAFGVLPIIIFVGSFFSILYHLGIIQWCIHKMAILLSRLLNLSGAESLGVSANIFIGMVESPMLVKPYITHMTTSELFCIMTAGMATVAGSVLGIYALMVGKAYAAHLIIASIMSAPAAVVIAKIMMPEREHPKTMGTVELSVKREAVNIIDAAAQGAVYGVQLAIQIGAVLIAFISLLALVNFLITKAGGVIGFEKLTLETIFGFVLKPLAFIMGIPWKDTTIVGELLGLKVAANEFIAYQRLSSEYLSVLSDRSIVIVTYALCGFANFGSMAIMISGIGGLAPTRRGDVARMGFKSVLSGCLAGFMTACVIGVII